MFEWVDKTELAYQNWAEDEPQGEGSFEDCVWLDASLDGEWHLTDCRNARGFICRTEKTRMY